jgi:hypothetical protein
MRREVSRGKMAESGSRRSPLSEQTMTKITLDEKALAALAPTENGVVAITDAAGNIVGFYAPVKQEYADQYAAAAARAASVWGEVGPPPGALPTAEVVKRLQSLEKTQ